jgi:hypothetical protein
MLTVAREIWWPVGGNDMSGEDYTTRSFMICTAHQVKIRVTKSRRMRWVGHVARMKARKGSYRVLVGRPDVQRSIGGHGRIILKRIFK